MRFYNAPEYGDRHTASSSEQPPTTKDACAFEIALLLILRGWSRLPRGYSLPALSSLVSVTDENGVRANEGVELTVWSLPLAVVFVERTGD